MKKITFVILCVSILLFGGYIALMTAFEGPIRIENPAFVSLNTDERSIDLPWYLNIGIEHDFTMTADGHSYFCYTLPDLFESAEMSIVAAWEEPSCIMYIGDSRAMEIIDADFPDIIWK